MIPSQKCINPRCLTQNKAREIIFYCSPKPCLKETWISGACVLARARVVVVVVVVWWWGTIMIDWNYFLSQIITCCHICTAEFNMPF